MGPIERQELLPLRLGGGGGVGQKHENNSDNRVNARNNNDDDDDAATNGGGGGIEASPVVVRLFCMNLTHWWVVRISI